MAEKIKEELLALSKDLGEVALDSVLSDGIFKDIPVVGALISISKIGISVSDLFLLSRIVQFINELDLKTQADVDELKQKFFRDKDYNRVGSKILLILERTDDSQKIKWIAQSFRLYLDRLITRADFMRLSTIINNAFVSDVERITVFDERKIITSQNDLIETYIIDHFYSIGLLETLGFDGGDAEGI